jgi:hypothetical protein
VKFYKVPVGPSTVMLGVLFVGSAVDAVVEAVANGETNVAALVTAAVSAVAVTISRSFQVWVASRDPQVEPE